ncbi:MAG TPA: LysR family transcriptional regulator [Pararobbsia sp.]|nr:LysR family transcriptional regulator [Pararobbsia sp.]
MGFDLRQLRYFVAVAEERHFGRAAARLSMTQPPLSQQIMALEETLGAALFARTRRSVELTPVGRDLLPEVRHLLALADGLPARAQSLARGEAGELSLAFVSTADYGLLPPLMRAFTERYPGVRLQLVESTSDIQVEELVAGRIDAGLMIPPVPPRHAGRLRYEPLIREPLVVAMSGDTAAWLDARLCAQPHRVPNDDAVPLAALADVPLVVFPRRLAPAFYDIIMDSYARAGLAPRVGQEAIQMQTIVSLVSAGMGVALVPRSLCNLRRTGVVYRPLRDAQPVVETGLLWRADDESPVLAGFVDVAKAWRASIGADAPITLNADNA